MTAINKNEPMSPARVHIFRKADNWQDRNGGYRVVMDGKKVGKIYSGRSIDFDANVGHHDIRIRSSWMGSNTYSFDAEERPYASCQ